MTIQCSIIIPSYNSATILPLILDALVAQTTPKEQWEVLLVDDGSTDNTQEVVEGYMDRLPLRYFFQENAGQGNARNLGLSHAVGKIMYFIGADQILNPSSIAEHMKVHDTYPEEHIGCLGFTTWDPQKTITPLMYFLEHGGHQFAYDKAEQFSTYGQSSYPALSYQFFYTSNISLKKSLLDKESFLPKFTSYGWEDIELGYRLATKHNFVLLYNKASIAHHHDEVREEEWAARMSKIASSGVLFESMYPEVRVLPHGWKKIIFHCLAWPPHIWFWKMMTKVLPLRQVYFLYYYSLMKRLTFDGIAKAPSTH